MYQVLYRKWRPKTFDEIVGQDSVVNVLKGQVASNRVSHALMFCGIRGTGKTSCAKIFSKAINCLHNSSGDPCLECEICRKIQSGSIIDVLEIDAASNNGVENIRSIREESNFVSSITKYKVYIIDEFHMLSSEAFNAFLRTLEEPPRNVVFILATTEFNKIPKTIVSRCQRFNFKRIDYNCIFSKLKQVVAYEKILIDDDSLMLISKNSEGSMRDALSILDRCVCSIDGHEINADYVRKTLGMCESGDVENLICAIIDSNLKLAFSILDNLYESGNNISYICEKMMRFFHDVFCFQSANVEFNDSFDTDKIKYISSKISLQKSVLCFDILRDSYSQMLKIDDKKTEIESSIVKIFESINRQNCYDLNNYIEKDNFRENKENNSNNDQNTLECWNDIIDEIGIKISSSLSSMLAGSHAYIQNDKLMIDTSVFVFSMIEKSLEKIKSLIFDKTKKSYEICMYPENFVEKKLNIDNIIDQAGNEGISVNID